MAMRSIRQLRTQTVPLRPAPPDSNDLLDDPLGIGVMGRARDADFAAHAQGQTSPLGPLPDLRWEGLFQALKEKNAHVGPSVGTRGSAVHDFGIDTSGTAGDALADVAGSMSGQPGSLEALRASATAPTKPTVAAPPPPPAPPPPGTLPPDPLARSRYQAGQMQPGSLASLRRSLYGGE